MKNGKLLTFIFILLTAIGLFGSIIHSPLSQTERGVVFNNTEIVN
ncbi:hypothetical protein [Terrilactibacillus laevilacticus]|uniref:Uncharacterized protein n=1 Tax=Terrilactibacillus laevilacticus TaxID=1380157 RepID=A0ABW5PLT8_9BACI|nr:hypothetical protein [Terrilactibacillus laevilacticus]